MFNQLQDSILGDPQTNSGYSLLLEINVGPTVAVLQGWSDLFKGIQT